MPSISVNAISWAALAPASRKCAPATEIALKRGTSCGAELDRVGDEPQRRARRPDPRAAAHVLLEDVVLDRAAQLRPVDALLLADRDVEREQDRRGAVDREAGADRVERDAVEEDLGVGERVERDADPARPPPRRRGGRSRSRTASAGRARRRARSRPARAGSGSARSTPRRCRSPSTGGSSRGGRGSRRGSCPRVNGNVAGRRDRLGVGGRSAGSVARRQRDARLAAHLVGAASSATAVQP